MIIARFGGVCSPKRHVSCLTVDDLLVRIADMEEDLDQAVERAWSFEERVGELEKDNERLAAELAEARADLRHAQQSRMALEVAELERG